MCCEDGRYLSLKITSELCCGTDQCRAEAGGESELTETLNLRDH
ncbi:hypothetical protein BLGI_4316 [Brevibacillus laterosporus GI-9]|nr:hypothetical protein BLGI_4316 [Brevibacillus laterosporus GI-9]